MAATDRVEAARDQLETALDADDVESINYHVRQALQYLHVEAERTAPDTGDADEETR